MASPATRTSSSRTDHRASPAPASSPSALGAFRWLLGLTVAAVVLFACYVRLSQTYPLNADGASNTLEAWSMLHGNWLLHGWMLTDVTFYTTELPEYMAVEAAHGLNSADVHIASAVTYTLLVILAGFLSKGKSTGREGWSRGLIAAGIMLAPMQDAILRPGAAPQGTGIMFLLSQPDHLGTQVPLLAIFLVLDRVPRRWYLPPLIGTSLAWVVMADTVAIADAAAPIAVVLLTRAAWAVLRRGDRLAAWHYEICMAAAAAAGAVTGLAAQRLIPWLGGYQMRPLHSNMMTLAALPRHLGTIGRGILVLFGADVFGAPPGAPTAFAWLHLAGVALAVAGLLLAFRGFLRSPDPLPAMLAAALVMNVVVFMVFVAGAIADQTWAAREIIAVLPFGAVLAGRVLGGPLAKPRLMPVLFLVLCGYVAALGYGMAQPRAHDSEVALAAWLEAHHLRTGLGTFNEDNPLTVKSGGRIRMLTVSWRRAGPSVPRWYQSNLGWYSPRAGWADFVITSPGFLYGSGLVPRREIIAAFGEPARVYRYQAFTIMVWRKNLLRDLGRPATAQMGKIG